MKRYALIVDDNPDILQQISDTIFLSSPLVPFTASSRDEAFGILRQRGLPEVLFLDYSMPGMSARDFVTTLETVTGRPPRIVLITGACNAKEVAATLGVSVVLEKPFLAAQIISAIQPQET
jgi:CheY-like chemotaxis protein